MIIVRKGAQLLDIATVVSGKFFTFIMLTVTVTQNYNDLIDKVGIISLVTFVHATSFRVLLSQRKTTMQAPVYRKATSSIGFKSLWFVYITLVAMMCEALKKHIATPAIHPRRGLSYRSFVSAASYSYVYTSSTVLLVLIVAKVPKNS